MKKKVLIVAELSANHNRNYDLAAKTIEAMARAGADAVKLQTFRPESLTLELDQGPFAPKTSGLWKGYTPWQLYQQAAMPYEWQPRLKELAESLGMILFSTPFDLEAVDFLEHMNVPMYKIAAMEINDIPLIEYAASKGRPMVFSTGVAALDDIEAALAACHRQNNEDITLLKCTSQYPAKVEQANLLTIPDMQQRFGLKVGLSDHSPGWMVPVVATSLGACMIEKHFILDRSLGGPDAAFSMEPQEFAEMVQAVRQAELALGEVDYSLSDADRLRRRSLFVVKDIAPGEIFTKENIRSVRPGHGLPPAEIHRVLGSRAADFLPQGKALQEDDIAKPFEKIG